MEYTRRLRNSSRWSRNPMVVMGSFSASPPMSAAPISDMRSLRGLGHSFGRCGKRRAGRGAWLSDAGSEKRFVLGRRESCRGFDDRSFDYRCFNRSGIQIAAGRALRRGTWRENRLFLDFQMSDFLLDLRLKLVRSALKFVQILPDLARDLRQLLGPEYDKGQHEEEDRLGKAHALHHTAGAGKAAIAARQRGDNFLFEIVVGRSSL